MVLAIHDSASATDSREIRILFLFLPNIFNLLSLYMPITTLIGISNPLLYHIIIIKDRLFIKSVLFYPNGFIYTNLFKAYQKKPVKWDC